MTNDNVVDLALARMIDGGRFETLHVFFSIVRYVTANDPGWAEATVLGDPFIDDAGSYVVPATKASADERILFSTRYPFERIDQTCLAADGSPRWRAGEPIGPEWSAVLKAGRLPEGEDA